MTETGTSRQIKLIRSLQDHKDKVWAVSIHNTLPLLATASSDRTSIVYDLSNNFSVVTKFSETHKKSIRSVGWKPSGEFPCLAAGSFDSTMSIWAKTDENYEAFNNGDSDDDSMYGSDDGLAEEGSSTSKQWSLMALIEGHENEIKCVAWSQDGSYLASCSRDKTIWIWETDEYNEEFECVNVLQDYHSQDVKFIKWGPDQHLVSASYDDTVKMFREPSPGDDLTCVCDLNAHDGTVWAVDFEPVSYIQRHQKGGDQNGGHSHWRFVSCSDDSSVKVWHLNAPKGDDENQGYLGDDTEDWQLQSKLPSVHKGTVYSVSWSPNSGRIASIGSDGNLVIYKEVSKQVRLEESGSDRDSGKEWAIDLVKPLAHGVFEINCVAWIDNHSEEKQTERIVTSGDNGTVNIWEVDF